MQHPYNFSSDTKETQSLSDSNVERDNTLPWYSFKSENDRHLINLLDVSEINRIEFVIYTDFWEEGVFKRLKSMLTRMTALQQVLFYVVLRDGNHPAGDLIGKLFELLQQHQITEVGIINYEPTKTFDLSEYLQNIQSLFIAKSKLSALLLMLTSYKNPLTRLVLFQCYDVNAINLKRMLEQTSTDFLTFSTEKQDDFNDMRAIFRLGNDSDTEPVNTRLRFYHTDNSETTYLKRPLDNFSHFWSTNLSEMNRLLHITNLGAGYIQEEINSVYLSEFTGNVQCEELKTFLKSFRVLSRLQIDVVGADAAWVMSELWVTMSKWFMDIVRSFVKIQTPRETNDRKDKIALYFDEYSNITLIGEFGSGCVYDIAFVGATDIMLLFTNITDYLAQEYADILVMLENVKKLVIDDVSRKIFGRIHETIEQKSFWPALTILTVDYDVRMINFHILFYSNVGLGINIFTRNNEAKELASFRQKTAKCVYADSLYRDAIRCVHNSRAN